MLRAKLAVKKIEGDKILYILAEPDRAVKSGAAPYYHNFIRPTAIAYIPGQPLKACAATRIPRPGVVAFVKVDGEVRKVRFQGIIVGGWLVQSME